MKWLSRGKRILIEQAARVAGRLCPPPRYEPLFMTLETVYLARAYYAVAELGIADLLRDGPKTCGELAAATGSHERTLFRILRALAGFGVFADDGQGRFSLTPRAWPLLNDAPGLERHWTMLVGSDVFWQSTGRVLEMLKTGQSGIELAFGKSFYEICRDRPELHETFRKGMSGWTDWQCREIVNAYDFSGFGRVVDVGGGSGSLIMEILHRHPRACGVLYDQPVTAERARERLAKAGLADRCEAVGGSFLESVPAGADVYVLKHVLRDWNDADVGKILRHCHAAMPPRAKLLVIDAVLDPGNGTDRLVKLLDVEQMFVTNGGLRTQAEFDRLLAESGFRSRSLHRTAIADTAILEAGKA